MNPEKAHLRLLLNDIHVDLGVFLTQVNNSVNDEHSQYVLLQWDNFKERLANLEHANKKYHLEYIQSDIEKFVNMANEDIVSFLENRNKMIHLKEMAATLMSRLT